MKSRILLFLFSVLASSTSHAAADLDKQLHNALVKQDDKAAASLINSGVGLKSYRGAPKSALVDAVFFRRPVIVKLLIEKGAAVNPSGEYDYPPLFSAVARGLEFVQILVEAGARLEYPELRDEAHKKGVSALLEAVRWNKENSLHNEYLAIVKYLTSKGAKVDFQNGKYQTALSIASEKGHLEIVKFLMSKGANLEHRDVLGRTPLHMATDKGHEEVVKHLVDHGAKTSAVTKERLTPLAIAKNRGFVSIAGFLERKTKTPAIADANDLNSNRRILGLVEIPRLFGASDPNGPPGQNPTRKIIPVELFAEPNTASKVVTVVNDPERLITADHGYEETSAIVYGLHGNWYLIEANNIRGWLSPTVAGPFRLYEKLVIDSMANFRSWDGQLFRVPGQPSSAFQFKGSREKIGVEVLQSKKVGDQPWFEVRLGPTPCDGVNPETQDPTPSPIQGWVPGYSKTDETTLWFFSRGC